jgi:hypothetical protein
MDDLVPMGDGLANEAADGRVNGAAVSVPQEVEGNLVERVYAIFMGSRHTNKQHDTPAGWDGSQPIIQFPEEEGQGVAEQMSHIKVTMTEDMLAKIQKVQVQSQQGGNSGRGSWEHGPRPSDMIPALQGLSSLHVSQGGSFPRGDGYPRVSRPLVAGMGDISPLQG